MLNNLTLAEIEQLTKHLRAVVETVIVRESKNILFEDLTDGAESEEYPPMIVITFNPCLRHWPESVIHSRPRSDEQDENPF